MASLQSPPNPWGSFCGIQLPWTWIRLTTMPDSSEINKSKCHRYNILAHLDIWHHLVYNMHEKRHFIEIIQWNPTDKNPTKTWLILSQFHFFKCIDHLWVSELSGDWHIFKVFGDITVNDEKVNAVLLLVCQLLYELLPRFFDLKPVSHFHFDVFSKLLSLLILQMWHNLCHLHCSTR